MKVYISCIDDKYYCYAAEESLYSVFSFGSDIIEHRNILRSAWTKEGVKAVASPLMTYDGAIKRYNRYRRKAEKYGFTVIPYGGIYKL